MQKLFQAGDTINVPKSYGKHITTIGDCGQKPEDQRDQHNYMTLPQPTECTALDIGIYRF